MEEREWYSGVREGYGVGVWKAIRSGQENLYSRTCFMVDNGLRMKFWKGRWYGDLPLKETFPILFVIANVEDAWVVEVWE